MVFTALAMTGLASASASASASAAAPGPPADITMTALSPGVLVADGTAQATATVTLTDAALNPIAGDANGLALSATDPGARFGPVIDNGDGTYAISVVSSTIAHQVVVTVTERATAISASQRLIETHGPAQIVAVQLAPSVITANTIATTTASITIADARGNPIAGDALLLQSSDPGVALGPVTDRGGGVYTANITGSGVPGAVSIRATDLSSNLLPSGSATLTEVTAPSLLGVVTMQWTFFYTRGYTVARSLMLAGAPPSASVVLDCAGHGCPFSHTSLKVGMQPRCGARPQQVCRRASVLVLTPEVGNHRLRPGARLTVRILRTGWIGKFYGFHVLSATAPAVSINCLAPGGTQPGVGCQ